MNKLILLNLVLIIGVDKRLIWIIEQSAMSGMLKAFRLCLSKSYLTAKQVETLYLILKVTMKPIETVQRYNVLTSNLL